MGEPKTVGGYKFKDWDKPYGDDAIGGCDNRKNLVGLSSKWAKSEGRDVPTGINSSGDAQTLIDNCRAYKNRDDDKDNERYKRPKNDKDNKGGSKKTTGPSNRKGLEIYEGVDGMSPEAFELYKETSLRGVDAANANKLQKIINSGKTEVAAISRDASIYGSLVGGFW